MIELKKQFTRLEWSLFWCYMWDYSDRIGIQEWLDYGIDNLLFIRSGARDAITVWYDAAEYDADYDNTFNREVARAIKNDPTWVDKLVAEFDEGWKRLVPYILEGRAIKRYMIISNVRINITAHVKQLMRI